MIQLLQIKFNVEIQHIYENPVFCHPDIAVDGKALLFKEFISCGIIQIKNICFEFFSGFLSRNAIVEIVQEIFPNLQSQKNH